MPFAPTAGDATHGLVNRAETCKSPGVRSALACWLAALALLVAGCGGSSGAKSNGVTSQTPDQILTEMKTDVAKATSVHVTGKINPGSSSVSLDLQLAKGKGGTGTVTFNGLTIQIIRDGDKLYFKGNQAFLKKYSGGAAQLLAGKWFVVPSSTSGFSSFKPLTNIVDLVGRILGAAPSTLKKGDTTTIGGQPALAIVDARTGGTLYVSTTGPVYPLQLKPKSGSQLVSFSDWDEPVTITPPENPVDLSKLTGG
jgi:hypothetical protein